MTKINPKIYFATITIGLLFIMTACTAGGYISHPAPPLVAAQESQWGGILSFKGESTPLSLVLATDKNDAKWARLVVLSAFGASLGDCGLSQGKFNCQVTSPGADSLVAKLSGAVGDLLEHDSSFLLVPNYDKKSVGAAGWEAAWETKDRLVYRRFKPQPWSLILTRPGAKHE